MHQLSLWQQPQLDQPSRPGLPPLSAGLSTRYLGFLDEDRGRAHALRLIITGHSGSGKTTALHHLLSHALRDRQNRWSEILILDGKQSSLAQYAGLEGVTYYGPWRVHLWAQRLKQLSTVLGERFQRQQQGADPGRWLIVADEVQRGVRAKGLGKIIRDSLDLIAEQSDALGDILLVSAQRELNAIPVSVRENKHGHLLLLRNGYYYLKLEGRLARSGRSAWLNPAEALERLDRPSELSLGPDSLPAALASLELPNLHPAVTLYLGAPGLGKTHTLLNLVTPDRRAIYLNLAQPGRETLLELIEQAGVILPGAISLRTGELVELAALALLAEPTLLLLDNVDQAETHMVVALNRLIPAAGEVALSANRPRTAAQQEKLEILYPRCEVVGLSRLDQPSARRLLWSVLRRSRFERPRAVERQVLLEANGNPAYLVSLARRVRTGSPDELRRLHLHQMFRTNLQWVLILLILGLLLTLRRYVHDSFVVMIAISLAYLVLRRRLYRR